MLPLCYAAPQVKSLGEIADLADLNGLVVEHSQDCFELLDVVSVLLQQGGELLDLVRVLVLVLLLLGRLQGFDLGFKLKDTSSNVLQSVH